MVKLTRKLNKMLVRAPTRCDLSLNLRAGNSVTTTKVNGPQLEPKPYTKIERQATMPDLCA